MDSLLPLLLFAGIIAAIWFLCTIWVRALTSVMATEEDQFPAKHDKILWVVLFLCVPIFAPFIYTACVERFNAKRNP
jgi:fructose-specific phosphotransferase system IIC component